MSRRGKPAPQRRRPPHRVEAGQRGLV